MDLEIRTPNLHFTAADRDGLDRIVRLEFGARAARVRRVTLRLFALREEGGRARFYCVASAQLAEDDASVIAECDDGEVRAAVADAATRLHRAMERRMRAEGGESARGVRARGAHARR